MRRTEQQILSRGFVEAYGANAVGALAVVMARTEGAGQRFVLEAVNDEMAAQAEDRMAECDDPLRRLVRKALDREPVCRMCVAAPACPRATNL